MKIIGAEEALATGSTKGKSHTAHYVFNNGSKQAVTIRNAADNGDTGSIRINANSGVVIHTDIGVGMRGASSLFITPIVSAGF
jgi:hypothetical protein|tara:strand:- start:349 stop:597 length:249 start_codon:yes stop_codon:yes gene_type:complete